MEFKEIYKLMFAPLTYFAGRLLNDFDAAKDIVQDVFLKFYQSNKKPESLVHVKNHLYMTTKNACFNYLESAGRKEKHLEELLIHFGVKEDAPAFLIENNLVAAELHKRALREIENLPDKCRQVMYLSYVEGKPDKEIEKELDISNDTLRQHKRLGRVALNKILKKYEITYKDIKFMVFIILCECIIACTNIIFTLFKK